jgi:PAS domain S-box-containing protein
MRFLSRVSIELKFVITTVAILVLALAILTVVHLQGMEVKNREVAASNTAHHAKIDTESIEHALRQYQGDLRMLLSTPPVVAIQRALANDGVDPVSGDSYDEWRDRLAAVFGALVGSNSTYMQVRYLNAEGVEIVRVDRREGITERIADDELQDESGRYYFTAALELRPGEIYMSPADLNVEGGEIQVPHTPVIRFASRVSDPFGRFGGAIVTNVLTAQFLASLGADGNVTSYLVDGSGQYLSHPDDSRTFANQLGTGIDLSTDVGAGAAARLTEGAALMVAGRIITSTPVEFADLSTSNEWWVLAELPLADVPAPNVSRLLAVAGLLVLAAATAAYVLARGTGRALRSGEEQLRVEVEWREAIRQTVAEGLVVYGSALRIVSVNAEGARLLGRPQSELVGQLATAHSIGVQWLTATGEEARSIDLPPVRAMQERRPVRGEAIGIRRSDGSVVQVRVNAVPVFQEGSSAPHHVVATYTDITEQLEEERVVTQTTAEVTSIFDSAHDADRVRRPERNDPAGERGRLPDVRLGSWRTSGAQRSGADG